MADLLPVIRVPKGSVTPYVLTVGDPDRAAAVGELLDSLGASAHLVGHSYGGFLALTLARQRPEGIRSVAVYDPVAYGVLRAPQDAEGLADLERVRTHPLFLDDVQGGGAAWFEVFVDYWNGPGAWRGMSPHGRDAFLRVGRKVFLEVWSLVHDRTPASAYAAIHAPVLLLGGAASPAAARRVVAILGESFPRARVRMIEGAGHMGPLTHGPLVNEAIAAHILTAS